MTAGASKPLVSIVVPSYNQGRFIRETIDSCLSQDYRPLEVLVMDGGSSDETVEVLRSYDAPELTWISERDKGVVDAVNKGFARARGEIISIQSSDDVFAPGAVSAAVAALQARPDAGLVYGNVELIDADSRQVGVHLLADFDLGDYLGRLQYIPQPGTFFRRGALDEVGHWRDSVSYAADADFWMRIAVRHPVIHVGRLMGRYRKHDEQRDTQSAKIDRDWAQAIDDLIASGRLDARQLRQARMGIQLAHYHYAAEGDWRGRTRALYGALLAFPPGLLDARFPKRELIPGRDPIWSALSRVKRALGFRARGT